MIPTEPMDARVRRWVVEALGNPDLVGFEEDPGVRLGTGGGLARRDQVGQQRAVGGGQADNVLLRHGGPPGREWRSSRSAYSIPRILSRQTLLVGVLVSRVAARWIARYARVPGDS